MKFRAIKYVQVNGRIYRPDKTFNADETRPDIQKYLEKGLIEAVTSPRNPPIHTLPVNPVTDMKEETPVVEEAPVKPTQLPIEEDVVEPKGNATITLDPLEKISTVADVKDSESEKEKEPEKETPATEGETEETKPEKPKTAKKPRSRKKKKE